jgi:hypothetical protein
LGKVYRSWSYSLWIFLHFSDASSLSGPNILLNTLFSNTKHSQTDRRTPVAFKTRYFVSR